MRSTNRLNQSQRTTIKLSTKIMAGIAGSSLFAAGVLMALATGTTTNTISIGSWNSAAIWSSGVPDDNSAANINHYLTLDKNISIAAGTYIINAPVIDATGGTAYSLSLSGSSENGVLDVKANMTVEGPCNMNSQGELIVRSGDTLRVGSTYFDNGSLVTVESGGVMIVNGNLENRNNSDKVVINGTLIVKGNFTGGNGSVISGNGSFTTTGSMTGEGSVFGQTPLTCNTGPCSGRSLVGFTNTIGSAQTICSGQTPNTLSGTTSATSPTYQWAKSTDNITFSNISGATSITYTPSPLTATTYFRRTVTSAGKSSVSNSVKITINTSGIWTGGTSTSWSNTANWCGGVVPTSTSDVIIKSGATNMPVIPSGSFSCKNLTIMSGASLTMASGSILNIKGDFTNYGTFTDNGGTTVFNGTALQQISGNSTTFSGLTINNTNDLLLNTTVSTKGVIKLVKSAIISNGKLTVLLDAGGIAYSSTDVGSIKGSINTQLSVKSNQYHYLSAPLEGQKLSDWNDDVAVGRGYTYYYYDETNTSKDYQTGWTGMSSVTAALTQMRGYAIYFTAAKVMDNSGTYTHGTQYTYNLTHTHTGYNGADGWNLIGNPFPSTIDWSASSGWTKTNVYNAIYCWDAVNNRYTSYINGVGVNGGSRYIAPMQAFWVRVDTTKTSGSIKATSAVRTTTAGTFLKNAADETTLKLIVSGNSYTDEAVVRLNADATNDFDDSYDAFKMLNEGNNPNIFTTDSKNQYAINTLKAMTEGEIEIPVGLTATFAGTHTLSVSGLESFDDSYTLTLVDKEKKVSYNLKEKNTIEFTSVAGDNSSRFSLKISKTAPVAENTNTSTTSTDNNNSSTTTTDNSSTTDNSTLSDPLVSAAIDAQSTSGTSMFVSNKNLIIRSMSSFANGSINIYSVNGLEVASLGSISFSSGEYVYNMSGLQPGIYIIKGMINKEAYNQKVFLE